MKKYELTLETKEIDGRTLYRIRALRDFGTVKKGDLGGWIEGEWNLSHNGNCWVADEAMVYDGAYAQEHSWICLRAKMSGEAQVCGKTFIGGDAEVSGHAWVYGRARVFNDWAFYTGKGEKSDDSNRNIRMCPC